MPDSLSRSQREDGITPADSRESQNRFCKETTRRRPKTCKYHYFAGDNQSHRSTACGFFTDDDVIRAILEIAKPPTSHLVEFSNGITERFASHGIGCIV